MRQAAQPISSANISILILAGGRATRMQGVDKGLVQLHGHTLVEHVYQQIATLSDDILISANRNQHTYQALLPDCFIISDEWCDFRGPLAGIDSALNYMKHDYLWVIPCDFIFLPTDCLSQLWQTLITTHSNAVYARVNARAFYPVCLLHRSVQHSLKAALAQQQLAVRHWLSKLNAQAVDFALNLDLPLNLNSLHDVGVLEQCYDITSRSYTTHSRF